MAVAALRYHAVKPATLAQRAVGWHKWAAFCAARRVDPIRTDGPTAANSALAEAFVADVCVTQGLQGDTAKKYLLAVGAAHKAQRLRNPCDVTTTSGDYNLLQAVQAGMNLHPAGNNQRVGFSADNVTALLHTPRFAGKSVTALTFTALASASFICLARAQFFTSKARADFDMITQVTRGDLEFTTLGDGRERATIFLPAGKANEHGRVLTFDSTGHQICAVVALRRMLAATPRAARCGPLFIDAYGAPITYRAWYEVVKMALPRLGLSPKLYGLHSFRRGGATALYNQTRDIELVESVGGWSHSSDTAWTYVEVDLDRLAAQSALIVTAGPVQLPARVQRRQRTHRLRAEQGGEPTAEPQR